MSSDGPRSPGRTGPSRRAWLEVIGMWLAGAVALRLAVSSGFSDDAVSVVKMLVLVYLPLGWMLRGRRDLADYGLTLDRWRASLAVCLVVSVVTLVPFWAANHVLQASILDRRFDPVLPAGLASIVIGEVLAVALPEEFFYRGYLQTRLDAILPPRWSLFGAKVGFGLPIASAIFVAGHLAVRPAFWQLGIFFPSLVFGWLRARTGSLLAPVLYHAVCNVGMLLLQPSYR